MVNRILSLIGWLGTVLVMAAAAISFARPAWQPRASYLAWAGLACVLAYLIGQWREFGRMFARRQARYGALAAMSVLVVLGILIAVNYIGARQNKRWDFTSNRQFSLSDQSRKVLAQLDEPLRVMVFAQEPDFQRYRDRLKEYEYASKRISSEYIDPDKKPTVARQNEVQQYGTVVFAYKGRTERVTSDTEQDLTNAIIKVVSGQQRKVYFTQGHGEKDTASAERDGYNGIAEALARENYLIEQLPLAQQGAVPADAAIVVVAGPRTDLFPGEIDALKKYLAGGGKLLLEVDPPETIKSPPLTNLVALAREWGIEVGNDAVVDASGMGRLLGTDASVPVAMSYPSHPITQRFNLLTAYPLARSVAPVPEGVNGHIAQSLVETSPQSWAESDIKALLESGQVSPDPSQGDKKGPVSIAAAVSARVAPADQKKPESNVTARPETRVVAFGDSDFVANAGLGIQGNRDLFLNTLGWLSQQENLISIRPREADDRRITMTAAQQSNAGWLSLLGIPGLIFAAGIRAWWRGR
jgi:ABC-type uncharacterized transport system involved in gliding motility auxiliary subunit